MSGQELLLECFKMYRCAPETVDEDNKVDLARHGGVEGELDPRATATRDYEERLLC